MLRARAAAIEHPLAIDLDAAGVRRVEPGDQVQQRGLAGTGLADHGDVLAAVEIEREFVQDGTVAEVA
jgi:hypothetical protein